MLFMDMSESSQREKVAFLCNAFCSLAVCMGAANERRFSLQSLLSLAVADSWSRRDQEYQHSPRL